jgi:hypothetical protein
MVTDLTPRGGGLRTGLYRLAGRYHDLRALRAEKPQLAAFRRFHAALADPRDVVYMFFTGGLLHWVARAAALVPPEVNLVLLGSDLAAAELDWIRRNIARPCHHFDLRIDDNAALDYVFRVSRHNFGWLHIDCFVAAPELFAEMRRLADDVAINCIWTNGRVGGFEVPHSAFVFVNHAAIAALARRGLSPSPRSYHHRGSAIGRYTGDRPTFSKVPSRRQLALLRRRLPLDGDGLPLYPSGSSYFPLLAVFQLTAGELGFRLNQVRNLERGATASAAQYSNEILHVNGIGTYRQVYAEHPTDLSLPLVQFYPLLLQADYAVLEQAAVTLPPSYAALAEELRSELARLGVPPERVRTNLAGFLAQRGIRPEVAMRLFGPPATPAAAVPAAAFPRAAARR